MANAGLLIYIYGKPLMHFIYKTMLTIHFHWLWKNIVYLALVFARTYPSEHGHSTMHKA